MNRPPVQLSLTAMRNATYFAKKRSEDLIERATRLQADPERGKRIAACLCRMCYYADGRIGGAAITTQPCASCGTDQTYSNTATDALCQSCAKTHDLCKRCGGDRETRTLRRVWPQFNPPVPNEPVPDEGSGDRH